MNEQSEGAYLQTVRSSTRHLLHAFPSFSQVTNQVVPTCQHAPVMAEQSACECHYGNDMKLERKQSGSAQNKQTKKRQTKGSQMYKNATRHTST